MVGAPLAALDAWLEPVVFVGVVSIAFERTDCPVLKGVAWLRHYVRESGRYVGARDLLRL